jgi:diguanylate cyclase (GGDEF)-like protein
MASSEKKIEHLLSLAGLPARESRGDVVARALRTAICLLDADAATCVLASARGKGDRLVLYAGSDTPAAMPSIVETSEALRTLTAERQVLLVPDHSDNPALAAADPCPGVEAGPVLFVPVDQRGGLPAYLAAYRKRGRATYTANETELMMLLSGWLATTLDHQRLAASAERLAIADDLTQIYNARFLRSALRREVRRADRHGQELTVIRVEVDGLEAFGEAHGATRANRLLKDMATVLAGRVRSFDLLGKDGAEGFMAILPQTSAHDALEVAERMRGAIAATAFAPAVAGEVTATFGVASFPHEGHDVDALLAVAERALELGRAKGGNCVATAAKKAA